MSDPNIFAVLIPFDGKNRARDAFRLQANAGWYRKAAEGIAEEPTIDSREPTPALQPDLEGNYNSADHILLTFDEKPKDPQRGWQFGTDPRSCDVLLGHRGTKGISSRHFCITIAENFWVKLHEDSTFGTAVGYNDEAKDKTRRKNTWLLSFEPRSQRQWGDIKIYVPNMKGLAFSIEFPNHQAGPPEYLANLLAFFAESRKALPPVTTLGLNSIPPTATPSKPQTPHHFPIHLNDELLGRGGFGEVRRVINTQNGQFYAAKRFFPPPQSQKSNKKRKLDEDHWLEQIRNEIAIMEENPHVSIKPSSHASGLIIRKPNIMPVVGFQETPDPTLYMPYYPLGNLQELKGISDAQYVSAFRQTLLGLRHLHGRRIAHRDLKPANFLVAEPFTIIIADFGMSKVANDRLLTTFCGTHLYAAPEVYPGNSHGYGPEVDIWSTGVIILGFLYDPPRHPNMKGLTPQQWNQRWSKALVEKVNDLDENEDKVIDILIHMLRVTPEERFSAEQCLERGCENGIFQKRPDGHIVNTNNTCENDNTEADPVDDDASQDGSSDNGTTTPVP
ncbi:hypothetical protein MMC22_003591 [Lobaria immixta]|nr:hypothetical protein [Lobaria immixta]